MLEALKKHWPEYLIEAAGLGLFMISAGLFATLLEHPQSPVHSAISSPLARRAWMGIAMGATAISIIYSRWGKQSGAHINPSVTLTFYRLGKVKGWDALFYVLAQFSGAALGISLVALPLGSLLADPSVNYVATRPGGGIVPAFFAEVGISFLLMLVVLTIGNTRTLNRYTGIFAGLLVAIYITFEAPISGMSMNPSRSFASALPAGLWQTLWIYFTAPPIGMLLAAESYLRIRGARAIYCAKLHHANNRRCIFCCRFSELEQGRSA